KREQKSSREETSPGPLKPAIIRRRLPRAMKFLRSELAGGPKAEAVVRSAAANARIRPDVLELAVDQAGILQRRDKAPAKRSGDCRRDGTGSILNASGGLQ